MTLLPLGYFQFSESRGTPRKQLENTANERAVLRSVFILCSLSLCLGLSVYFEQKNMSKRREKEHLKFFEKCAFPFLFGFHFVVVH